MPPKRFHEFSQRPVRERWPLEFDLTGVDRDYQVRKEKIELEGYEMGKQMSNSFVAGRSVDINRPAASVGYNPRDHEYPKMLFHQKKKDANWEREYKRLTLYNQLHPEKPMELPVVPFAFVTVNNKQEEDARLKEGYGLRAPASDDQATEEVPELHPTRKAQVARA